MAKSLEKADYLLLETPYFISDRKTRKTVKVYEPEKQLSSHLVIRNDCSTRRTSIIATFSKRPTLSRICADMRSWSHIGRSIFISNNL